MPRNQERVDNARDSLQQYLDGQSLEEAMIDCLTNLRHLAAAEDVNFDDCIRISEFHFEEEN